MTAAKRSRPRTGAPGVRLECPGWNKRTRHVLERLIERGAYQHLPVVMDFDNTLIRGDVGEATLAILVRDGLINGPRLPRTLSPAFRPSGRSMVTLRTSANPAAYYRAFLAPTAHGDADPTPLANAYAWVVEVMENLSPWDVIQATRKACALAKPDGPGCVEVNPGQTQFPAPVFYPEMVELVAQLIRNKFEVWVVSASNVWSVRCMVLEELNPRLRRHGVKEGLRADRVIGVSTLLRDRRTALYKDALLVHEDHRYAVLDEKALRGYRLTSRLQYPVPTYSGKIACICDAIGARPYLCAGDSPGDHAALSFSQNRLWIARLDKAVYQEKTNELIRKLGSAGWLIQPAFNGTNTGFLADLKEIGQLAPGSSEIRRAAFLVATLMRRTAKG